MLGLIAAATISAADFGPPVSQAEAEASVRAWANSGLKDPYSARYSFDPVEPTTCFYFTGRMYGYSMTFRVNAKNSYGAYAGDDLQTIMVLNRKGQPWTDVYPGDFRARTNCKHVDLPTESSGAR